MPRKFPASPVFRNAALRNMLFLLLVLAAASGLGYLATRYHVQRDVTHNANNSLDSVSVKVLGQLSGPVNITVYATAQDARLGDIRKIIREFVSLCLEKGAACVLGALTPTEIITAQRAGAEMVKL